MMTEEHKRKIGEANRISKKGKKLSESHKRNIRLSALGRPHPHKGHKKSEEEKDKIRKLKILYYDKIGRITDVSRSLRMSSLYLNWRSSVFTRDNYTCVFCGYKGKELNADHIVPFSKIINQFKEETGLSSEELRISLLSHEPLWDLNNGRTLCIKCHKSTETYGLNAKKKQVVVK